MPFEYKDIVEAVLKHLTDRIALAVLFVCVVLKLISIFMTVPLLQNHSATIWVALLFAACYLPTRPILEWWNERESTQKERRNARHKFIETHMKIEKTLKSLKADEIGILTSFGGASTHEFHINDGVLSNLAMKGIVRRVSELGYFGSYSLSEDIVSFLAHNNFGTIVEAITKLKAGAG